MLKCLWILTRPSPAIHTYQEQIGEIQVADQQPPQPSQSQATPPPTIAPMLHSESPRAELLEKFDGSAEGCHDFLWQCNNFFSQQPEIYREENTSCAFLLSLLTGKALDWVSVVWDHDHDNKILR